MAKERVAVLGGGVAGVTAAWALSATPELRDRYAVTIHQTGWRLGGKGASGRNAAHGQRIEEHGLHIWLGFYDNAFTLMRSCYEELGRPEDAPLATWQDAFAPCHDILLFEEWRGRWVAHPFHLPGNAFVPGDDRPFSFGALVRALATALRSAWTHALAVRDELPAAHLRLPVPDWVEGLVGELGLDVRRLEPEGALHLLDLTGRLADLAALEAGVAARLFRTFRDWLWDHVVADRVEDDELRMLFCLADAAAVLVGGIVEDRLLDRGFGAVNDEELSAWLARHGARPLTLRAPFVRGLYDLGFAFPDGDVGRPDMAAGKALQAFIRLVFTYRGAVLWKMQAGMGDTMFAPLHLVLRDRGVRMELFQHVTRLGLAADRRTVDELDVVRQVDVRSPPYDPLVDVAGLPCWPSAPDWRQLVQGARLRKAGADLERDPNPLGRPPETLKRGKDFDHVVLAIPVGALAPLCGELLADAANPRFRRMVEGSRTVATQAFQAWLDADLRAGLGWAHARDFVASSYVEPLDTYADMSHLLAREAWPEKDGVRSIAYVCGVLPERGLTTQDEADAHARKAALDFLREDTGPLWPSGRVGDLGPAALYTRANFSGSERYVLTPAGSVRHRLGADESGYDNLVLAGDWTRNGIDGGSVEAAVTSGMLAARALSGSPGHVRGTSGWLESDRGDGPSG